MGLAIDLPGADASRQLSQLAQGRSVSADEMDRGQGVTGFGRVNQKVQVKSNILSAPSTRTGAPVAAARAKAGTTRSA